MTTHVALSGGIDSTAALARVLRSTPPSQVRTYSIDYGQRHRDRELAAAAAVAHHSGVHHDVIPVALPALSALTGDGPVPDGHYAHETMAATVVPGRNLLMASLLVTRATAGDSIVFGVHAGDHPIYPDCRPEFWGHLSAAIERAYTVTVATPWLIIDKSAIIAAEPHAPYALTWSCYKGGQRQCGRCGTCVERAEAFSLAGVPDPTDYDDPRYWRVAVAAAAAGGAVQ